jgi:hypothetical protein
MGTIKLLVRVDIDERGNDQTQKQDESEVKEFSQCFRKHVNDVNETFVKSQSPQEFVRSQKYACCLKPLNPYFSGHIWAKVLHASFWFNFFHDVFNCSTFTKIKIIFWAS